MDEYIKNDALAYIIKYIEKTGERIVYSKGLPQFFISDIMDDDIVCPIGLEDKKLLLFDNFVCWDEGEYIGEVSADDSNAFERSRSTASSVSSVSSISEAFGSSIGKR